jgi:putative DNA primase/helicase
MAETAKRAPRAPKQPAEPVALWEQRLVFTDKGYPASAGNIGLILEHDEPWKGQLRFDARSNRIVLGPDAPIADGGARSYVASDDTRIAMWFEHSRFGIRVSPSSASLTGAINVVAEGDTFDPVRDYLEGLRWDGKPRVATWLAAYLGADNTRLHAEYGKCWAVSAVARVFQPGCQVDHTLVMIGPQGKRKSSALRVLATRDEWFTDQVPSLSDRKAAAEVLEGRWIIELGELDALKRSELSTAKAWLTAREDRFRAAYARRAESHGRRCVFAASTNEETFLRDSTGNRRFWPVSVGNVDLEALERDRDQLWAEAVHLFRAGEPWHITDHEIAAESIVVQEEHRQGDPWESAIESYLARKSDVLIADLLKDAIDLDIARQDQAAANRAARCLQKLGWKRKQKRAGQDRFWIYVKENSNG